MEIKKFYQYKDILIVVFCVLVLDILLKNYFTIVYGETGFRLIAFDLIISFIAIFLGKKATSSAELPIWQVKYEGNMIRKQLLITFFLGAIIVVTNTLIWNNSNGDTVAWASFTSFFEPILISGRAALVEELFFRLLTFSFIVVIVRKISKSDIVSFIIGALLSSIIFGLYHQGFYLAFIYGILLCYIYKNNGLIPAMVIHFFSDAIPFIMIYIKHKN
jgi:membrane protease YdiL (CAAX protease family)